MEFNQTYSNLTNALKKITDNNELDDILNITDNPIITQNTTNKTIEHNNQDIYSSKFLNFSSVTDSHGEFTINNQQDLINNTYDFRLSMTDIFKANNNDDNNDLIILDKQQISLENFENLCTNNSDTNLFCTMSINNNNNNNQQRYGYDMKIKNKPTNTESSMLHVNDVNELHLSLDKDKSENNANEHTKNFYTPLTFSHELPLTLTNQKFLSFNNVNNEILSFTKSNLSVSRELSKNQNISNDDNNKTPFYLSQTRVNNETTDEINRLKRNISLIPNSILKLYQSVCSSSTEFSFIYAVSAQMCQNILPMNYLVSLKIVLLLSITSIRNTENNQIPIPILVIGSDSSNINKIMMEIGNSAKRFLLSYDNFHTGSMINENIIEAGPILLAKGGIFYIGELSNLKSIQLDKILRDLERGKVFVDKSPINYKINCSVWSYWSTFDRNRTKDINTLYTIMKIFGIPIVLEESNSNDIIIDYLLDEACSNEFLNDDDELSISYEDMKYYLSVIAERKVNLSKNMEILLQKYFTFSNLQKSGHLTNKTFEILQQFSESFAKLCFRQEIIEDDIIGSIYLLENFMKNLLNSNNPDFLMNFELKTNHIEEIDHKFNEFKSKFREFIQNN